MAAPSSSDYELLTEHFGYPPVSLLDDIINTVNVLADRALDSVERLLLSIPPQNLGFTEPPSEKQPTGATPNPPSSAEEAAKLEIENGTHQLETLLNAAIDKNFDLFELYTMRNILTVRPEDQPFMRLAHYEGLDFSAGPDRPTTESVTDLRRRLQASLRLHVALEAERARNDKLLRELRGLVGAGAGGAVKMEEAGEGKPSAFAFLGDRGGLEAGGADQPITTTTEFALSQLQALRALSTSLRNIIPDLAEGSSASTPSGAAAAADEDDSGKKTWRRERVEYVEGASRKHLENAGGLELGPQGEVRDGEWQGDGRRLTRGEVEGLEKVVAILGRGGGGGGGAGEDAAAAAGEGAGGDAMDES